MAEVTNELIFETAKSVLTQVSSLGTKVHEMKAEVQAIRGHMLATQQDIANIYAILGDQSHQIDRINRRLDLADA
ncbi:hypothetical protein [Methylobrevis pamukkalensis]|uniref:Uncharacterized protein n=1 Tax=Methylobrevis pamukkalensis TaxID=1439726 RepID=A0A1E3GX19_9HYPH|nr:hypothetical protein [Methylobrevis pamukkalensis]ODN68619.1 hypothetical protein A6302_04073 [Methylobrevis pamukkalensis]